MSGRSVLPDPPRQASAEDAPAWFLHAMAQKPALRDVVVEGCAIRYRIWGDTSLPGLVLVHGGAAHSGWWDHVAPLIGDHHVVALDLSGHGDSGRRPVYELQTWADEVVAVADAAGLDRPVIVGHSLGGWVAVTTGGQHADRVGAVVFIDSPLNDQPPEEEKLRHRRRPTRVYASVEEAVGRFVTLPEQDSLLPFVREHVAQQSLRAVDGGWTWKFDPAFFGSRPRLRDLLVELAVPAALLRCEHGLVDDAMAREMRELVGGQLPVVALPFTGHHPMLDQPLALVAGLRTLLALWPSR
jgi:pimeloyl-ACP methyl ester carboxylesterase